MNPIFIISPVAALLLTFALIPRLRALAKQIRLIDRPGQRKVHEAPVPVIGGISIFIATAASLLMVSPYVSGIGVYTPLFIASALLLIMGVLDDRFDLSPVLKLIAQLIMAHAVFFLDIRVESLGGFLGIHTLAPWVQYSLTILLVTGFINAFNLMDGIDGLAAGLATIGFALFALLAVLIGQYALALICTTILGSLTAFLRFNLSQKRKTFMGDAGSLFLGFVLVVAGIHLIQAAAATTYNATTLFVSIAIMLVPVLDALRVFGKRAAQGKSIMHGDKTHLHHLVLTLGLKHRQATLFILSMSGLVMAAGFVCFALSGITLAVICMLLAFFGMVSLLQFNNRLLHWKGRIRHMERPSFREE